MTIFNKYPYSDIQAPSLKHGGQNHACSRTYKSVKCFKENVKHEYFKPFKCLIESRKDSKETEYLLDRFSYSYITLTNFEWKSNRYIS